ncbi:MAG: histidinol dehydrogenase [Planctomycetes bacterium GWF2_42_9]|nr:MAG: histidinol dehydrogenase [Planctomycetes bacterium GWF2_42_9]HAL45319.1 histidinol dehydrogenase [Phycisphaerales bacterium]
MNTNEHNLKTIFISQRAEKDFFSKLADFRSKIINAPLLKDEDCEKVRNIIRDIQLRQDEAVAEYTQKFDNASLTSDKFRISHKELKAAHKNIDRELLSSIKKSIKNVRLYQKQIFTGKNKKFANTGVKFSAIERIGICVPGASAPLPSTVIMTAVPAQVAGVKEIAVVSPPRYNGSIHPVILATCYELGIDEVYRIGGVQAVAALAYGTPSIPRVYKIVGPGNSWVQTAKKEVFGQVDIDSVAGPSEVLIIADKNANAAYIAADMLSQAEHAPGSAVLFTDSQKLADDVLINLDSQCEKLSRAQETAKCLLNFSLIACFKNMDEVIRQANSFASEHLQIQCGKSSRKISDKIKNAGAIFIGEFSPVATGDYFAGPSHTLPTGASARFFSPLSSNDFIKTTSLIEYSKKMLAKSADDIVRIAEAEGLDAHAKSVKIRM